LRRGDEAIKPSAAVHIKVTVLAAIDTKPQLSVHPKKKGLRAAVRGISRANDQDVKPSPP
jgi:hypothetical protein